MSKNVIRDGQTRRGHIDAVPRLHDSLTFEYRPMLAEVVETIEADAAKVSTKDGVRLIADETANYLVEWSEEDEKGGKVEIDFDNVRRLPFPLLNKLYRVVAGMTPTDELPKADSDELRERLDSLRQKAEGVPPVQAQEQGAKNSEKG